jgi:hypothetical protein
MKECRATTGAATVRGNPDNLYKVSPNNIENKIKSVLFLSDVLLTAKLKLSILELETSFNSNLLAILPISTTSFI